MLQHRPENPDISRDPALQEAFDAFIQQTRVPLDFQTRVMARVQQRPARRGRWGWLERWWTWWTHHWSPLEVWAVAVCVLVSLAFNLGLGYYTWKQRHVITALGQELTATRAQVHQAQAESHQWQARVAALTDQLAALQEQRRAPQEPLVASVLDQAGVAFNQGRYDDAIALSEAVIRVEPTDSRAYLQAGRAYAAKGRDNEAVAAFNTGLQQNPGSAQSHAIYQELGIVYSKQGRDDDAITALRAATIFAPHDFYAQQLLGAAYLQKGLQREARATLNEALRLAKASPGGQESVPLVEAMLRDIQPQVPPPPTPTAPEKSKLTVQAVPAGSTIQFDNSTLEYHPGMELAPGRYDLVVTHEGYKPVRKQVTISTADVTLDVALESEQKYKLTVQATPADSTVQLEHSKVKYRPGLEMIPGRYEVVVMRDGYKTTRRPVIITNTDVTLDIALEQEKYKLTVEATPTDSTVKLDNSTFDYRPGLEVPPGRYDLIVTREGYKTTRRQVTVSKTDVTLKVALEQEKYKLTVRATPVESTVKLANSNLEYRPGMEVTAGRYDITVSREGYKPARRTITVSTADVTLDVALESDKAPGPRIALKQESIPKNVGPTQARVIIIGQATAPDGVAAVTVNGGTAELGADGTFAREVLLKVGENVIRVTALDINGNEGQETFTISRASAKLLDTTSKLAPLTPPTIAILSPEGLRVEAREARTTLRGRVTPPDGVAAVTVNGNAAALESDGTFRVGVTLDVGENPIVVAAMDTQRHVTEQTFTISRPGGALSPPPTRRLALIIGNAKYQVSPLRNAVNDASDMHEVLKKLGFETTLRLNATFQQMEDAIDSFRLKLRQGGVGLFYYTGHGVQIEGQNYLVPVDAPLQTPANVKYRSVPVNGLLERMADAGNELNIIILDACRENVFMREWRALERGLAIAKAVQGSFIAYSTAPGDVALDGSGRNGVYTKHLLKYITRRGITVEELFKLVRNAVAEETKGKQIPWENSSLVDDFYLVRE
jgi:tetratricopeptide (TPR) repeat protein